MANFTYKAILQEFQTMLIEMPFDRITVSALAGRCGISTNTFYYHFRDIYDLLGAWLEDKRRIYLDGDPEQDWKAALKRLLGDIQRVPQVVTHLTGSLAWERFERYVFSTTELWYYQWLRQRMERIGAAVPEEVLRSLAGVSCYSVIGFLLKFVWLHAEVDVDAEVERLGKIYCGCVEYVAKKAAEEQKGTLPENVSLQKDAFA